jgi:hypothetical protein
MFPTNRYHRTSGAQMLPRLMTGSFLCPNFKIQIFNRKEAARLAAVAAICAPF